MKPRRAAETARPENYLLNPMMTFTSRGNWIELDQPRDPLKSKTWEAVRSMVNTRRRNPDLYPEDFAEMVHAARVEKAFPNVRTWKRNWLEAHTTTGAERTVKTACSRLAPNPIGDHKSTEATGAMLASLDLAAPPAPRIEDQTPRDSNPTQPQESPSQGILDDWEITA
jgi:hypothetical protein